MTDLIECHWEIRSRFAYIPGTHHASSGSIDNGDLLCVRDIDENARAIAVKLKRFWMARQFDATLQLHRPR